MNGRGSSLSGQRALGLVETWRPPTGSSTPTAVSCTSGGTRVSDGTLTPADLIPGYLGTDHLYLRVFALTRRYLAGDRQYLFV
jgi:hypothetical protein